MKKLVAKILLGASVATSLFAASSAQAYPLHEAKQIMRDMYCKLLDRQVSDVEMSGWVAYLMVPGTHTKAVVRRFIMGIEYNRRAYWGNTKEEYVNNLYLDLLGRWPSAQELTWSVQTIADRGNIPVINHIMDSQEYMTNVGPNRVPAGESVLGCQ